MFHTLALIVSTFLVAAFVGLIVRQSPHGASLRDRIAIIRTAVDVGAVTLAQAQVNTQNDVDYAVIDNLRRYSWLFDQIVFDDTVNPGTGGATLTYGYTRLTQPAGAGFRAVQPGVRAGPGDPPAVHRGPQAPRWRVQPRPRARQPRLGDHERADVPDAAAHHRRPVPVPAGTDPRRHRRRRHRLRRHQQGARRLHHRGHRRQHRRLERLDPGHRHHPAARQQPPRRGRRLAVEDRPLARRRRRPGRAGRAPPGKKAIIGNTKSITRMRSLARWAAMYTSVKDDLGRQIEMYGNWALIDIGDLVDGSGPIIPITSGGLTDLFAVTFGLDALHGASMANKPLVQTWLPDFTVAGAVKTGELEMGPVAGVLKNTKACAVLRGVKVQ
jgi:hypothetical protein